MEGNGGLHMETVLIVICAFSYGFLHFLAALPGAGYVLPRTPSNTVTVTSIHTTFIRAPTTQADTVTITQTLPMTATRCSDCGPSNVCSHDPLQLLD